MMKKSIGTLLLIVGLVLIILLASGAYRLDEKEKAIITQFGKIVGEPVTAPGLHFKVPFIQDVTFFEKRIMEWSGDATQIPTKDKRFIWVDSTARWVIDDPKLYFTSVRIEREAQSRLDDILNSAMKEVISSLDLIESVRSSNREFVFVDDMMGATDEMTEAKLTEITVGRHKIGERVKVIASDKLERMGIKLVDIRLRRINYVESVRTKVYDRMISERNRMAEFFRSEGEGRRMEIEGQKEKELKKILSGAYKEAEEIRGRADAEATRIYAEAYNADPEFYGFLKTLEGYKNTVGAGTDLILSTDSDYFRFLKSIDQ